MIGVGIIRDQAVVLRPAWHRASAVPWMAPLVALAASLTLTQFFTYLNDTTSNRRGILGVISICG